MEGLHAIPERVSVQKIADEQVHLFAEVGKAKNIQVQAEVSENLTVWADENHVRLVLRNLVNNALKFTPEGGRVKILAESGQNTVVISVQDNGVGMTAEQVGKLFRKNQSFTTYGTGGEKGTGLGLQLCQETVTKNGGEIWATSEQGKGSTFSFRIPTQA
jgi:signal transduction histidine kinase